MNARLTVAALAAVILFAAGVTTAFAQSISLMAPGSGDTTQNSITLEWTHSGLTSPMFLVQQCQSASACTQGSNFRVGGVTSPATITTLGAGTRITAETTYYLRIITSDLMTSSNIQTYRTAEPPDTPPVVTAGSAQTGIAEGASVTLTGTATPSTDPTGDNTIATLMWEQVGGAPDGSGNCATNAPCNTPTAAGSRLALTGANMLTATFTAPADLTADATYYFRLSAMDGTQTGRAWTSVMVTGVDADARISLQTTPAATRTAAGLAVTVTSGDDITARATATDSDTNVGSFTYAWTQTISAGSNDEVAADAARMVMLTGENTPQLSFTAPELFVDADGNAVAAEAEGAQPALMGVLYFRLVIAGGCASAAGACEQRLIVTVQPPSAGGEAVNNAVLPHVLRNTTHGIHNSIYQRIQQRQRQDGRWK